MRANGTHQTIPHGRVTRILAFSLLSVLAASQVGADGGYISDAVAVSADQRAILIQNGSEISMTFSTGYTGEGDDFGWIIPTPVPPAVEDVSEAGESGEAAFRILDQVTAPEISVGSGGSVGCFPAGTAVLTARGARAIQMVEPGMEVQAFDHWAGEWTLATVLEQKSFQWEGDMITIRTGAATLEATGNHPFCVLRGRRLASRPVSGEIPPAEQRPAGGGRWVEARDLREGDVLLSRVGREAIITGLSSERQRREVYFLEIQGRHNFAVHREGILVHNGGHGEGEKTSAPSGSKGLAPVTVYGTVTLEHYEASVLGAADASALMAWLESNGYPVDPAARRVLDTYIDREWAFVAVKLNPGERRPYRNEFLPPLAIKFRHDELIFPLRISSVSTRETIKMTLYVIARSTVTSPNFPTSVLRYEDEHDEPLDPELYIETCIRETIAEAGGGLVVMWGGGFSSRKVFDELMKAPFAEDDRVFLTRLEARMSPAEMTDDIRFVVAPSPRYFHVDIRAREGWYSALIEAAQEGASDRVRKLLEEGANVNTASMDYESGEDATPLTAASAAGHTGVVKILLDAGADPYGTRTDYYGDPALVKAAEAGHTDVVRILLEAPAAVSTRKTQVDMALRAAAAAGQAAVVALLLDAGADVDAGGGLGWTALMSAARNGHTEVSRVLLDAGADVNAAGESRGRTALTWAADEGHAETVAMLLAAGADIEARERDGSTALIKAVRRGHTEVAKVLVAAEESLETPPGDGWPTLVEAAWAGGAEVVSVLVEAGADVNVRGRFGFTALMKAAGDGHVEVVKILLAGGADVNAARDNGWTALMQAAWGGRDEVIEILLEAGADVNAKAEIGWTALMIAEQQDHASIVDLLRTAGAGE